MTTKAPPGPSRPRSGKLTLSDIQRGKSKLPPRIICHGVPGVGKSSCPAFGPKPIWLMSKLETGIVSLRDADLVPEGVENFPECQTWQDVFDLIELLRTSDHQYKTLVIDTLNGLERMCHDHVVQRDYNNRYAAFAAYQSGFKVAVNDWRLFLAELDRLREARGMLIWLIAHTKVQNFKNPEGPDYDRYQPDLNPETWSVTHGWADIVLFMNYDQEAVKEVGAGKAKGKGGVNRFVYTTRTAAWDAKHRHGLPEIISMGSSGKESWDNFKTAMQAVNGGGA